MVLQITIFDTKIEYFLPQKNLPIWDSISLSENPNLPIWVQENITGMYKQTVSLLLCNSVDKHARTEHTVKS